MFRFLLLVSLLCSAQLVAAFVPRHQSQVTNTFKTIGTATLPMRQPQFLLSPSAVATTATTTALSMKASQDGTGRGLYIFAFVFLACVWCFTVPPEFRRAYICDDKCFQEKYQEAPQCKTCVKGEDWINGVKAYYANGGGKFSGVYAWGFVLFNGFKLLLLCYTTTVLYCMSELM